MCGMRRALLDQLLRDPPTPVAMMPRITPPERSFLVSARVSMSPMATMLWRVR